MSDNRRGCAIETPHTAHAKAVGVARPCSAWDLFVVSEGLQCGNCLCVIGRTTRPDETRRPTEG